MDKVAVAAGDRTGESNTTTVMAQRKERINKKVPERQRKRTRKAAVVIEPTAIFPFTPGYSAAMPGGS